MADSFYTVFSWMGEDLGLDIYEIQVYAVIYSFSHNGENTCNSSLNYISKVTRMCRKKVFSVIKDLESRGLITKDKYKSNGLPRCEYRVVDPEKKRREGKRNRLIREYEEEVKSGKRKRFESFLKN